jgi:hypothetical protein
MNPAMPGDTRHERLLVKIRMVLAVVALAAAGAVYVFKHLL